MEHGPLAAPSLSPPEEPQQRAGADLQHPITSRKLASTWRRFLFAASQPSQEDSVQNGASELVRIPAPRPFRAAVLLLKLAPYGTFFAISVLPVLADLGWASGRRSFNLKIVTPYVLVIPHTEYTVLGGRRAVRGEYGLVEQRSKEL